MPNFMAKVTFVIIADKKLHLWHAKTKRISLIFENIFRWLILWLKLHL